MLNKSLMVIDPSVHQPEISSFNHISSLTGISCTYHLPALTNEKSIDDELVNSCGIILMGSASSVHDQSEWQKRLSDNMIRAIDLEIPILGICYGHQLIGHLFGGTVGFLWNRQKMMGIRNVHIQKTELWGEPISGPLMFSHKEGVTTCPKDFSIIASSDDVKIEGIAHNSKPIWSFQPHIEATYPFAKRVKISNDDFKKAFQFGIQLLNKFIHYLDK